MYWISGTLCVEVRLVACSCEATHQNIHPTITLGNLCTYVHLVASSCKGAYLAAPLLAECSKTVHQEERGLLRVDSLAKLCRVRGKVVGQEALCAKFPNQLLALENQCQSWVRRADYYMELAHSGLTLSGVYSSF